MLIAPSKTERINPWPSQISDQHSLDVFYRVFKFNNCFGWNWNNKIPFTNCHEESYLRLCEFFQIFITAFDTPRKLMRRAIHKISCLSKKQNIKNYPSSLWRFLHAMSLIHKYSPKIFDQLSIFSYCRHIS